MNPFTVNPFRMNPFTVNPFRMNPFTVNPFRMNPFTVNPFPSGLSLQGEGRMNPLPSMFPSRTSKIRLEGVRPDAHTGPSGGERPYGWGRLTVTNI